MNFYRPRFNIILSVLAALALACGCATDKEKAEKHLAALRLHIESSANTGTSGQTITVLRDQPVSVTIATEPVLTEANIVAATLLETPGGYAVEIKFDETGGWILVQQSAANPGKHFAVFGQWGEKLKDSRWLAAPQISHRIVGGVLAFTPDCSRDEAKELVLGLNNVAKKVAKGAMKL